MILIVTFPCYPCAFPQLTHDFTVLIYVYDFALFYFIWKLPDYFQKL